MSFHHSALAEGVPCVRRMVQAEQPYLAIIQAVERDHCDLIFVASHGWREEVAQLLGSETLKVLVHSNVPVLVHKFSAPD